MDVVKKYKIKRYINGELIEVDDDIVVEYLFTIYINEYEYITLICTPSSLLHLAVGFLYSDEIITSYNDINSINVFEKEGYVDIKIVNKNNINNKLNEKRAITSGCGKGSIYYKSLKKLKIKPGDTLNIDKLDYKNINKLINKFNEKSEVFKNTGGVHSVALSNFKEILFFKEDIGRHNALDKVIGKCLVDNIDINNKLILTSGRITSEIILKCFNLNIKYIVSRSAITDMAMKLSKELGIIVIGFARGEKMNIYND